MLVLSRKVGEKIHVGPDVTVTVVRVAGDKVRIGIEAPDDVQVLRGELVVDATQDEEGATPDVSGVLPQSED